MAGKSILIIPVVASMGLQLQGCSVTAQFATAAIEFEVAKTDPFRIFQLRNHATLHKTKDYTEEHTS